MVVRCRLPLLAALLGLAAAGCVERKFVIRTDPPDAVIWLNRERRIAGGDGVEVPFSFYGTYDVRIEADGYRTLVTNEPVPAPWYAWPVLDFLTEVVLPFTIHDVRELSYSLEPSPPAPDLSTPEALGRAAEEAKRRNAEMRERAEAMRREVNEGDPAEVR